MVESLPFEVRAIDERPGPQSWPDRGAIMARLRPDRGPIVSLFEAEIKADLEQN